MLLTGSISQKRRSLSYASVNESGKQNWYVELKSNLLRIQSKYIEHGKTTRHVLLRRRFRIGISSQIVLLVESIAQKRCSLTYVSVGVSVKPNWYVELKLNLLRMQRNYIGHSKTTWQV